MASLDISSDLLETSFTPQEVNTAMQFLAKDLTIAYLQNSKVQIIRQLAFQTFDKPEEDIQNQRNRAYLRGRLDILGELIDGALNPTPVPVESPSSPSTNSQ